MHPILASRRNLALYLTAWLPVVAVLTAGMVVTGWGDWVQSLLFVVPLALVYAFLCLSAWYPCQAMPLHRERAEVALATHLATATVSALLWSAGSETLGVVVFNLDDGGYTVLASAVAMVTVVVIVALMGLGSLLGRRLPAGVLPWEG